MDLHNREMVIAQVLESNEKEPRLLNRFVVMRLKWFLTGPIMFIVFVFLTQYQFNQASEKEQDRLELDSLSRDYLLDHAGWTTNKLIYDSCLELVHRSDGARAWNLWFLDEVAGANQTPQAVAFVEEGRARLNEFLPDLAPVQCEPPGPEPQPPPGYNPDAGPPPTSTKEKP